MRLLKTTYIYLLALTIFPIAWLKEQPFALKMAYLNTLAPAHTHRKRIWK